MGSLRSLKNWSSRFPEKRQQQSAALYARQKANGTRWRDRNPEKHKELLRRGRLLRKFGLTVEQYEQMAKAQRYRCAICEKKELKRSLAVDHCPYTNKVRALLCGTCNNHLGIYERHRTKFEAYLSRYGARR